MRTTQDQGTVSYIEVLYMVIRVTKKGQDITSNTKTCKHLCFLENPLWLAQLVVLNLEFLLS